MTDSQYRLMDCIADNFSNKSFYFSELKDYGNFYPATLTSLVNLGYVSKKNDSRGKTVYQYIQPDTQEETENNKHKMELEFQINQAKGVLDHLIRSKQSWIKQLQEMGLEFPEEKYETWSSIVQEQTQDFLDKKQKQLLSFITLKSAF